MAKLSSNSERLLVDLIQSHNPTLLLCDRAKLVTNIKEDELHGMISELQKEGFINVTWADDLPYHVTLSNLARTYVEQTATSERQKKMVGSKETPKIFISHRSTDKEFADILVDFFVGTGIPKELVFCSSLPGNDIKEKISTEVRKALKKSVLNIAILSQEYYKSIYCLNEAGVLWYCDDVPVIPIALPEITNDDMLGFLDAEYKLRRLDCDDDISYIYDTVKQETSANQELTSVVIREIQKLKERYAKLIGNRVITKTDGMSDCKSDMSEMTTDDERIVLYYILNKNVRTISKEAVIKWLHTNELYGVNVDNAFELLASLGKGVDRDDSLQLDLAFFRSVSKKAQEKMAELEKYVEKHRILAEATFRKLWDEGKIGQIEKLFCAYIIEKGMCIFKTHWTMNEQIKDIKQWEKENSLLPKLSSNYGVCLGFFVRNRLVYESSYTCEDETLEYTLCPSLQDFLFECPDDYREQLGAVKNTYYLELPF